MTSKENHQRSLRDIEEESASRNQFSDILNTYHYRESPNAKSKDCLKTTNQSNMNNKTMLELIAEESNDLQL